MTPNMTAATAILEEARRAATRAAAVVAETREVLAAGECSDADLRRAVRQAEKAADAVLTAAAGVRVAKKYEEALEAENRAVLERLDLIRRKQARERFAKATTATARLLKATIGEMDQLASEFAEAETIIGNRSGPSASNLADWHLATASLGNLSEIFQTAVDRQS